MAQEHGTVAPGQQRMNIGVLLRKKVSSLNEGSSNDESGFERIYPRRRDHPSVG